MLEFQNLRQPAVAIKGLQIVLLIIAISIFGAGSLGWAFFAFGTMLGGLLNAIALLVCFILGYTQIQKTPFEMGLSTYYCVAIFVSSILLMASGYSLFVASGVFCLFLTLVYGADVYLAFANMTSRPVSFPPTMSTGTSNQPTGDSVDASGASVTNPNNIYVTNPTYPQTMNYPPTAPNNSPSPMNYPPPEYPTNMPVNPRA